jgi:hypothetical protein
LEVLSLSYHATFTCDHLSQDTGISKHLLSFPIVGLWASF